MCTISQKQAIVRNQLRKIIQTQLAVIDTAYFVRRAKNATSILQGNTGHTNTSYMSRKAKKRLHAMNSASPV
jgi:hypothetical protein